MSDDRTPALLHDIVHHGERISMIYRSHINRETFMQDATACDAVLWNLIVVGEACMRLGDRFHDDHPDIPWRDVIGLRNVLAHGYDVVQWPRIVIVIEQHLPDLVKYARRLLDAYGPPPQNESQ
jgi:uncharacterized protein with HEPN domain